MYWIIPILALTMMLWIAFDVALLYILGSDWLGFMITFCVNIVILSAIDSVQN